jgi:pimeloyl-ACP methyl ester carboxylesterase
MKKRPNNQSHFWLQLACILSGIVGLLAYAASKFIPGKMVVAVCAAGILGFMITLILLALRQKGVGAVVRTIIVSLLAVIVGTYVLLFGFVSLFQDAVANQTASFFQPRTISAEAADALTATEVLPLDLTASDGVQLRGWLVRNSTEAKSPLLIYFGGSGSEASEMIPSAKSLVGWSVALVNYRGFGLSEGTPTHQNVLADALVVYDTLSARADIDPDQIAIMGYSLGSGVAVYLSAERPVIGTVLVSLYDTWTLIGVQPSPLYAPLSGIMKRYFDSVSRAPAILSPLLCLAGSSDRVISPELSRRLADEWGGEVTLIEYPGEDHGLLFHANSSWMDILGFLKKLSI